MGRGETYLDEKQWAFDVEVEGVVKAGFCGVFEIDHGHYAGCWGGYVSSRGDIKGREGDIPLGMTTSILPNLSTAVEIIFSISGILEASA